MRPAREIMAELASTGMTPEQIALVMELSAAVSAEARPVADEAAERRRERDREYQAQKRAERRQMSADSSDVDDSRPLSRPPNENKSNPPTHTPGNISTREAADAHVTVWLAWREKNPFPRPHWAPKPLWSDFLKNRKAKTLPNTVAAHDKLLRDVAAACHRTRWPPGRVFRACVEQGWGAIYDTAEMKEAINGQQPRKPNGRPRDRGPDPILDALARATAEARELERSPADPASGFGTGHALPAQQSGRH